MKRILYTILIVCSFYLGMSFIYWDINPEHWDKFARVACVLLLLIFNPFSWEALKVNEAIKENTDFLKDYYETSDLGVPSDH